MFHSSTRTGQHSQMMVLHKDEEEEYQVEVRGLQEHQVYEFWVTAATASGEGEMSAIVARKPNARGEIKIFLLKTVIIIIRNCLRYRM